MSPRLREVTTASGATAVQILRKHRGKLTVLKHLGSAHCEAELAAVLAAGEEDLADYGAAEPLELELGLPINASTRRGHEPWSGRGHLSSSMQSPSPG